MLSFVDAYILLASTICGLSSILSPFDQRHYTVLLLSLRSRCYYICSSFWFLVVQVLLSVLLNMGSVQIFLFW